MIVCDHTRGLLRPLVDFFFCGTFDYGAEILVFGGWLVGYLCGDGIDLCLFLVGDCLGSV